MESNFPPVKCLVICLDSGMGCPTKVQMIARKDSEQFYINFPTPIAKAMDFAKGEVVEWTVADKKHLILSRTGFHNDRREMHARKQHIQL